MSAPRWASAVLRRLAEKSEADVLIGDLEEAHRSRVSRRGALLAAVFTSIEAVDIAFMLVRRRLRLRGPRLSWLDVKLGARMLVRYPVLTIVGTGSLALAIALGAAAFAFISLVLWPRMPLPDGDRLVSVAVRDEASNQGELRVTADYLRWRGGTATLTDFAATRRLFLNLTNGDGLVQPITVAEVTPSMFAMTRVAPIMGRVLNDADTNAAAPPVMVLGERIWRERFGADPGIVGKALVLGDTPTAVVGVMPADYRFPSIDELWRPLKLNETSAPRAGIGMRIWARLKPGVTSAQANAELAVLSAQAATDWPATHAHLKAAIGPPALSMLTDPIERALLASANLVACLVVLLISGNVALLMFARAATRESEIVVRTALGASRGRLISQFFAEALVLSAAAAAAGLWLAERTMTWAVTTFAFVANDGELLPFWITPRLPLISMAYGVGLALLAAAMTGVLPALKMTRGVSSRLRETTAGGGGLKFGGVWTVLIVSQIALTVFAPSMVFVLRRGMHQTETQQIGVPAEQYLTARLGGGSGLTWEQYLAAVRRVREDIAATPGITHATLADKLPLMWNGYYQIQMDEGGAAPPSGDMGDAYPISTAAVEPDFFRTFETPAMAGRLLVPSDYAGAARVIVVNQSFVDTVLGGRNAVGRRIRYQRAGNDGQRPPDATVQPWLEIVGVVRDLGMTGTDRSGAGVYLPLNIRAVNSVMIAARVSGDMTAATNALRSIAASANRSLSLEEVRPLNQVREYEVRTMGYVARLFSILSGTALVLALSGIYAVMSFAVSRRTREIGIRVALGSSRSRVVLTILRRPLIQMATGIVVGAALTVVLVNAFGLTLISALGTAGYIVVMIGVCLLACVVPARRALTVDPIAALRNE
jgi:predicted permease